MKAQIFYFLHMQNYDAGSQNCEIKHLDLLQMTIIQLILQEFL